MPPSKDPTRPIQRPWLRFVMSLLTATTLLAACGGSGSLKQPEALTNVDVSLPMTVLPTGHAALELNISGQTSTFIIDTGAGLQGVTQAFADRLNLPRISGDIGGMGSGGNFNTYAVSLPPISVAGHTLTDTWAIVLPVPAGTPFDGVIGANFLKEFVVSLDWEAKSVRFQTPDRFVPPVDAVTIPFELQGRFHQMSVQATLMDRKGRCQVDTGAFNAITVLRPAVESFGWRDAFSPRVRTVTGFGAGGNSDGRDYSDIVRLSKVQIGSFTFSHVVTDLSLAQEGFFATDGFMCNIGLEVWRRFSLTINYATKTMYLRPNAAYPQIFDFQRSGLMLRPEGNRMQVMEVMPGSAAEIAGIAREEWLTSINGIPVLQWRSADLRALWLQAAGTHIMLTVQGKEPGPSQRSVEMILKELLPIS
jgi:Aspartyl protease/PDZ domain